MKKQIVYYAVLLVLIVYILSGALHLFNTLYPPVELPLTQAAAERVGGKILRVSYPHIFRLNVEWHNLDMTLYSFDKGDCWEVYYAHEGHIIETRDGRKLWPNLGVNYVALDKATGNVVRFGIYE